MNERKSREQAVRSAQDRPDDPLFVPHIEDVKIAAVRMAADGDEYALLIESICGVTDDSQPVEQYNGMLGVTTAFVAAHQAPACQVQWNANLASIYTNPGNVSGVRWGSGTMISDDLFLTCGHLFDQTGGGWERPRQNGTTNIISPQEIARNMHLNFNFQVDPLGNLRAEQSFPILDLLEYRLGGLDMAICRIGGNPGAIFGRTLVSTTDAVVGDMICIIGHPAGQPKRIEAGPTTAISGNLIRYNDIDTLGGNSGSGILRASDGRLVGIHTNGGCTSASPADGGTNFGQRIEAVIAASPTLRFPTWQELDRNPATIQIVASGGNLYQRHNTGRIYRYTGVPFTGWQELDRNPATVDIVASGGNLYQRHNTGRIYRYTGVPLTGWQELDRNPATVQIVADGANLYQRHNTGRIWRFTG